MTTLTAHRSDGVTPSTVQWQRCNVDGELCVDLAGETGLTYAVDDDLDLSVRVIADDRASDVWFPGAAPPGDFYIYNGFEGSMAAAVNTSPWYTAFNSNDPPPFDPAKWVTLTPGTDSTAQALGLTITSAMATLPGNLGPLLFAGVSTAGAHTANGTTTWYSWKFRLPSAEFQAAYGEFMWAAEWHEQSPGIGLSTGFGFLDYHDGFGDPTSTRNNVQLRFRPGGGSTDSPTYEDWVAPWPSDVMQLDAWYKIVIGISWDTVASNAGGTGRFELYITKPDSSPLVLRQNVGSSNGDGPLWTNPHPFPTLYHVPSTSAVDAPGFGFYNYRRALASGSSRIDVDECYIGPTKASVGG